MADQTLLFIYNPNAGHGKIRQDLSFLLEALSREYRMEVYPTTGKNDGFHRLATAGDFDTIAVAGGDGMLHEALNGLLKNGMHASMLYFPYGTVNDFATTHQISRKLREQIQDLKLSQAQTIDVGLFNEEYFAYVAAFGLLTNVSYNTPQQYKNRFGPLAYWIQSLMEVDYIHWENNSFEVKVEYDGGTFEGDILFGAISNSRYIAGLDFFEVDSELLKDGLLESLFIKRPMNLMELEQILRALREHDYSSSFFYHLQSSFYRIQASKPVNWTLDGEFGGSVIDARIQAVSGRFSIVLPTKERGR